MQTLRLFCDVVALQSFSKAALRHGITQSAVSQRIRSLEEALGVDLLDRSRRPFVPTAAGTLLATEGAELAQRYDELLDAVRSYEAPLTGSVRVDAIYSAGIGLLEGLRNRFESAHTSVQVVLEYRTPDEVAAAVRQRSCDLGIISYPQSWSEVVARPLRDELMAAVCRREHPLARQRSVRPATLDRWQLVGFDPALPVGRAVRTYLRQHGSRAHFEQTIDNIDTVKAVLRDSDRIAILPVRTVLPEVETGLLQAVALRPSLSRPVGVITARREQLSPATEAFVAFLQTHAQAINPMELEAPPPSPAPPIRTSDKTSARAATP